MTQGWVASVFFLTMASGLCVAQSESQSLADVARKNRAEKKAAVTLSDDNFVRRTPVDSKTGAAFHLLIIAFSRRTAISSLPRIPERRSKAGKTAEDLKKEDSKKEELKKQLDSYKASRDAWDLSAKRYHDLLANEPDEFRRQMYQDALDNDRRNVSFYQQKIDETEAKMGTDSDADATKADPTTSQRQ